MSASRRERGTAGTLSARMMDLMGARIVSGAFKVEASLPPESALCEKYGLSRTPLREAMKELHAKGLVAMAPKSGTRVLPESNWNQLDPDVLRWRFECGADEWLLKQLQELRAAFEPEACRLAALNGSAEEHAAISSAFARLASAHPDPHGMVDPDVEFHMAIVASTRNIFLASIGSALRIALRLQFKLAAERKKFPARELEAHRSICAAILKRDGEDAANHMKTLIAQSRASLARVLRARTKPRVQQTVRRRSRPAVEA